MQPANMVHFLLNNHTYRVIGDLPLVNSSGTDYAGIARAAGVRDVVDIATRDELWDLLDDVGRSPRYVLAVVDIEPQEEWRKARPRASKGRR
jgi:hypothetical protein